MISRMQNYCAPTFSTTGQYVVISALRDSEWLSLSMPLRALYYFFASFLFPSFFCWLWALSVSGCRVVGGRGPPRAESPQLEEQHVPQAVGLPPGAHTEKVKPIVYPLAAGPAARSEGGHCSTLPRQCCHMGNRRNSNLQPTKSKANNPASYAEQWSLRVSCFSITTGWKKGVILLPLSLIIPGGHKFIGLHHMSEDKVRGPGCVNDNSALLTLALNPILNPIWRRHFSSFYPLCENKLKGTKKRKWIYKMLSDSLNRTLFTLTSLSGGTFWELYVKLKHSRSEMYRN